MNIELPGLSAEDSKRLMAMGEREAFKEGQWLIQADEAMDSVFWIVEGSAQVSHDRIMFEDPVVADLAAGEMLGELSFLDGRPASTQVRALADGELLAVKHEALTAAIESDPQFGTRFHRYLALTIGNRLRRMLHLV